MTIARLMVDGEIYEYDARYTMHMACNVFGDVFCVLFFFSLLIWSCACQPFIYLSNATTEWIVSESSIAHYIFIQLVIFCLFVFLVVVSK